MIDFFQNSYCINLERRPDRWEHMIREEFWFPVHHIFGFDYPANPQAGTWYTYQWIVKMAKISGFDHIVLFEDDCHFINDARTVIPQALAELPEDWDMFYLGGNIDGVCYRFKKHLARLTYCQSTHAYAVRHTIYDAILESQPDNYMDLWYCRNIIPNQNCYITIPMVAVQRADYSDIERREVDYTTWMEDRFWRNLK